ncbi:acyl-CoA synthetase (AMP-forming)/AMP-acid ligase II [Cylindrospermum stagnale PCC 7417]|uniref:Acyl-CoA synthetase (AMP-forming)/AMP-acid ligase II n=1 Tax=Cylindrospermum stagnale PCC 7417 TaxID=56107 RepID=K9WUL2_9NOST|nr:AMP-binding protein [Cylindrospermum stagnale]AFZ23898.1 acyl-CoA synthetase (AMP-forming)/AMP-acid ligase II [Cylindrospermum stagnale PCC 7417]
MSNLYRPINKTALKQQFVCNRLITTPLGFDKFKKVDIEQSLASRFEEQVSKYPQSVAVKTQTETLTYEQLNNNANILAKSILSLRGEKQEVIVILLEKSASYITTILGILKTGKIFVPLDASFPLERLAYILADSQAVLIVTNNQNLTLASKLAVNGCQIFNIDDIEHNIYPKNPTIKIVPDTPAYIIYTSGSTGKPKGVVQSHRNALHYCMNDTNTLLISPEDRVIFLYSCSALGGILCICYTLLNGASLYSFNVKEEGLSNLVDWLIQEEITIYHSFATLFRHFVDTLTGREQFPKIRLVKLGGEATLQRDVELYKKHFSANCILYASLGATETGTFRNFIVEQDTQIKNSTVPIGYAVEDMDIVLLDEAGVEVKNGVGEIAVKSKYLALGYWQKPELTNAVFIPDCQGGSERIYRTGDLGRIEADGCLVHMGRKDFQVKIRGFRIEVTEIEMALFNTGAIKEAVVVAREDIPEDKRLVAYIVPKQQPVPTTRELRQYLQNKLPDYMVPSAFVFLNALPLTPNGKIDRLALPAPNLAQPEMTATFVAPRDDLECQLTEIWEKVLGIEPIGVKDNFFELGGHSLLAVRLFAEIELKFAKKLPLAALFPFDTVEAIAQIIRAEAKKDLQNQSIATWSSLVAMQPQGSKPPVFLIHPQGGELLCYRDLVTYLGTEQPVYGLQPQGLNGKQPPYTRVEDMAAHYIREIQTIQPQGPYLLGGYSFGGVVAFEMAQQLHRQGQKVGLLAMFDTCRPGYSERLSLLKRIPLHLDNLVHKGPDYIWHKAMNLSQLAKYHLQQKYKSYLNAASQVLEMVQQIDSTKKQLDVISANSQALWGYTFEAYPGAVTLLRTEDENRADAVGVKYEPQFGWGEIVMGGLEIHYIPGSHLSLLDKPYVQVLAEKFKVCLEKAQTMNLVTEE